MAEIQEGKEENVVFVKWSAKQIESRITIYCFPIFDPFLYPQLFQLVCLEFSSRELAFL